MDIKKARRKPFDVEYVEVTEENMREVATWCLGVVGKAHGDQFVKLNDKGALGTHQTKAFIGDFVVHHLDVNSFRKFGKKSFAKTFEKIGPDRSEAVHVARDATDGKFVTQEYAEENPGTTVVETSYKNASEGELPKDADPS